MDAEPLVTWKPIAAMLNMKERAFWSLVHDGGLPHFKINERVIRFRVSEVNAWLKARTARGDAL